MRLLITGGFGFIGSHAVNYLSPTNRVVIVDNLTYAADLRRVSPSIEYYQEDISKLDWHKILKAERPDVLINFAAETHVDNSIAGIGKFSRSNYTGVQKILEAVRKSNLNIHLIQISTDEVYGDTGLEDSYEFVEDDRLKPSNPYSATKTSADLWLLACARTYGDFCFTIVRATNNYGPGQHTEKFIPTVIEAILKRKKIPVYGTGQNLREWLYVEDFVRGIQKVIQNKKTAQGQIFNFGSGKRVSNISLVKIICDNLGVFWKDYVEYVDDRPGHDLRYALNSNKARTTLDWKPVVSLNEGLEHCIRDMEERC